jgi:hypothetical protein
MFRTIIADFTQNGFNDVNISKIAFGQSYSTVMKLIEELNESWEINKKPYDQGCCSNAGFWVSLLCCGCLCWLIYRSCMPKARQYFIINADKLAPIVEKYENELMTNNIEISLIRRGDCPTYLRFIIGFGSK